MNLKLWCYLIWLLYDWWLYFRNDILPIFLKWYFEITFIPSKKDCADRRFEITFFSISGQHNLLKDFLCSSFWNDIWLSFRNEQRRPIYILNCFTTVILKWGRENFRTQNYFGQENTKYFNDENTTFLYFSYTDFYARLGPYPCVEIKFLEKGDGLLCQILIILQC